MGVRGPFGLFKYQASEGSFVFPIKLQPETVAANFGSSGNSEPAGSLTPFLPSVSRSGSKNAIGVHPRTASVKITAIGLTGENAVGTIVRIPILSKTTAWKKGDTGTYQGDTGIVVRINPENIV